MTKDNEMRIVSLAPSVTSILYAIGAKRALVGVTKWCADVADVDRLPRLGDCWRMGSVDEILRLKPTLVVGSMPYKQETVAKILEQPVSFLGMNPRTIEDVYADVRLLGRITGHTSQAEGVVQKMKKEFLAIERKARKNGRKLRVYCEAWPNPRISSPPWVAEVAKICGGEMVMPAGQKVTDKQVAAGQPEVIVLAWAATGDKAKPEEAYRVQAWKDLPAIRKRQVYVVRDELLNTPGPPLMKGAMELARIISRVASQKEQA